MISGKQNRTLTCSTNNLYKLDGRCYCGQNNFIMVIFDVEKADSPQGRRNPEILRIHFYLQVCYDFVPWSWERFCSIFMVVYGHVYSDIIMWYGRNGWMEEIFLFQFFAQFMFINVGIQQTFLKKNLEDIILLWGHWYPFFGFLVTFTLGFKARMGPSLACSMTSMWCILQIHLWCEISWPLSLRVTFCQSGSTS